MSELDILGLLKRARAWVDCGVGCQAASPLGVSCSCGAEDTREQLDAAIQRLERAEIVEGVAYMGPGEWRWYQGYKPDQPGDRRAILIVLEADDDEKKPQASHGSEATHADWEFALNEYGGFPDDFDFSPMAVAKEVADLRSKILYYIALYQEAKDE